MMTLLKLGSYSGEAEIAGVPRRVTVDEKGFHVHDVTLEEASDLLRALSTGEIRAYQPAGTQSEAMQLVFAAQNTCKCSSPACLEEAPPVAPAAEKDSPSSKESVVEEKPALEPGVAPEQPATQSESVEEKKSVSQKKKSTHAAQAPKEKPASKKSVADDISEDPEETVSGSPEDPTEPKAAAEPAEEKSDAGEEISKSDDESSEVEEDSSENDAAEGDESEMFGKLLSASTMREVIDIFEENGIKTLAAIQKKAQELQETVPLLKNAGGALPTRLARTAKGMGIKK